MWYSKCTLKKRTTDGIDPETRLPRFKTQVIFEDLPCDIFNKTRRVATQTPNGTVYQTVSEPTLKIFPSSEKNLPDENDVLEVDGVEYRVTRRDDYRDAGSNEYRGSRLTLAVPDQTDETTKVSIEASVSTGAEVT